MNVIAVYSPSDHPLAGCLAAHLLAEAIATDGPTASLVDLTADGRGPHAAPDTAADEAGPGHGAVAAYRDIVSSLAAHGTDIVLLNLPGFVIPERHPVLSIVDLFLVHVPAMDAEADAGPVGFIADTLALLHKAHCFVMSGAPNDDDGVAELAMRLADHGPICTTVLPETRSIMATVGPGVTAAARTLDGAAAGAVRGVWRYVLERLRIDEQVGAARSGDAGDTPVALENIVVTYKGARTACFAVDISTTGMAFVSNLEVRTGDRLAVDIPAVGRLIGKVRHAKDYRIGIQFIAPGREHLKAVLTLSNILSGRTMAPA